MAGAIPSPSLLPSHILCLLWGCGCHQGWQSHTSPSTLKIHVMAQELSFILTTWISHGCAEWIWLQSGGSKFGLLRALIEESWARDTEMRNSMSSIISFPSSCFPCCLFPLFAGILWSSLEQWLKGVRDWTCQWTGREQTGGAEKRSPLPSAYSFPGKQKANNVRIDEKMN